MENCRGLNGVALSVMRCGESGWYRIEAVFEVKKEIPAERLIRGR
jgi:hypothetical protein